MTSHARPGWQHRRRELVREGIRAGLTLVVALIVAFELWWAMAMLAVMAQG